MMTEYKGKTTVTRSTRRNVHPRKMSYQKNKMQTFPFCQYVLICLATVAVLRFTSVDANADVPERYKYYTKRLCRP